MVPCIYTPIKVFSLYKGGRMELYLIGGKAKSGKDTFAKDLQEAYEPYFKKVAMIHITEPLLELAKNYFGWNGEEDEKPRELLQQLGIEIIRDKMKEKDLLKRHLVDKIEILSSFFDVIIVPDLRLVEEFVYLKEKYPKAVQIHLLREKENGLLENEKSHLTEKDLENDYLYDYEIQNTSLEKLKELAEEIVLQRERMCFK